MQPSRNRVLVLFTSLYSNWPHGHLAVNFLPAVLSPYDGEQYQVSVTPPSNFEMNRGSTERT